MSYQNLDSEIMLALAIWLLAMLIFVVMLLVVFVKFLYEHRTTSEQSLKDELEMMREPVLQSKENIPTKEKELNSPA